MSHQLNQLMDQAETCILARVIYCGGALTEFLEKECIALNLKFESAYTEALSRGLYRFLGERYQKVLTSTIRMAEEDIRSGLIENKADLHFYFESAARNDVPQMPRQKVVVDLTIDARQAGLFELLENLTGGVWPVLPPVVAQVA